MTTIISKDELKSEILDITLIDVRDNRAYKFGHIQGAEDIPLENLKDEAQKRYKKEEKLVIYGENEEMGSNAARQLEEAGFSNIQLYKTGFEEWRHSHLPIKRVDIGNELRE